MLTEKNLIDLSRQYRVKVTRISGDITRYKFHGGNPRHVIHFMYHDTIMRYGAYGVPGFNHPLTGRYIPPVFFADGAYGLECDSIDEPMSACAVVVDAPYQPPGHINMYRIKHTRTTLYHQQKKKCYYCEKVVAKQAITCDHLIPMCRGGKDEPSNWVMACYQCNAAKRDMMPDDFIRLLKRA